MKNNVFIISAAHQYIYIYDAIKRFHQGENNVLYFLNFNGEEESLLLNRMLLDIDWHDVCEFKLYRRKNLIWRYFVFRSIVERLKMQDIDSIYLSQLGTSYSYLILNSLQCGSKNITDDGVSLHLRASERLENLKVGAKYNTPKLLLKRVLFKLYEPAHLRYFTTNNIEICSADELVVNDLSNLRALSKQNRMVGGVFFLGSPFVSCNMMTMSNYLELLQVSFDNYRDAQVVYFPHRGEREIELAAIQSNFANVKISRNSGPVEIYLLSNPHPTKIAGFYSGAIPNILKIYGDRFEVDSIVVPDKYYRKYSNGAAGRVIYQEYSKCKSDKFKMILIS